MKRLFIFLPTMLVYICMNAQDNKVFKGFLYNEEYKVYIYHNFYEKNIVSSIQELFGELPGYLGHELDPRQWLFTSAKIVGPNKAKIEIVNDYGSEDLTATLTVDKDGYYTLKQIKGSRMKIAVNRKWVKIPTELKFKKKEKPDYL